MTNDELRQAIEDANRMLSALTKDSRNYGDLLAHMNALLAEQRRRAEAPVASAPASPLWVQPVVVQPTWVPQTPWLPPYEITCSAQ